LTSDFRFTHPGQGERRCLRSLLTSSQNHPAQRLASLTVMAMVLSSRDRIRQRLLMTMVNGHRQDAAACVSLSKSTMSKTVWPGKPNPPERPAAAGGGSLSASGSSVNRLEPPLV